MSNDDTLNRLREAFPKGSTVYTSLEHVAASGLSRDISVISLTNSGPRFWNNDVLDAGIGNRSRRKFGRGVRVGGAGMDMGFHLVYTLSRVLYDDGYALNHRWL